ncbi:2OG-Fe dioxygenase family protein [Pseudoxanthomonas sp. LjRoot143]|uniref:2OG-Fe dioxygenase family protein n=1 Tax=Pseudoxanthomonas sp. LjRoot143 TaxID=3342266 RepID=UPI003ECF0729
MFQPPFCPADEAVRRVQERGYAVLEPRAMAEAICSDLDALAPLLPSWDRLEVDGYLKDGGRYRRRRHSCFVVEAGDMRQVPHRAHWQSLDYNALHGGMQRWFEPIEPAVAGAPAWRQLLMGLGRWCSVLKGERPWYVEAHQFRIDTTDGIGRPTPEGAHRDGVDFVAVLLLDRQGIKGGETRVFAAAGPDGQRFTLDAPWSLLFLDDERVIHESTPIQPLGDHGHRDTLVLTFRREGFQGDSATG